MECPVPVPEDLQVQRRVPTRFPFTSILAPGSEASTSTSYAMVPCGPRSTPGGGGLTHPATNNTTAAPAAGNNLVFIIPETSSSGTNFQLRFLEHFEDTP